MKIRDESIPPLVRKIEDLAAGNEGNAPHARSTSDAIASCCSTHTPLFMRPVQDAEETITEYHKEKLAEFEKHFRRATEIEKDFGTGG